MARDCVLLLLLLLCTFCIVQATTPDIAKLNETLNNETNAKLQEVFEMMKEKNWMERLVKAISAQKIKLAAKKPQEVAEMKIEDAIKLAQQQEGFDKPQDALRPAHRVVGKLNKDVLKQGELQGLTNDEVNDGFGLRRAKRSEPEDAHGQSATETTTSSNTQAQSTSSAALAAASSSTAHLIASSSQSAASGNSAITNTQDITTAHLASTTSQEYDWGLHPCPAEFNHCVYGDCVGLGLDVYTCYCWDGYSGMSCELLELFEVKSKLSKIGGSSNPALAALDNPSAYSAATAIAHYLAGDLQGYQ